MSPIKPEQTIRAQIHQDVAHLDGDDLEIVRLLVSRARMGRRQYGPSELRNEKRDLVVETLEEVIDGLFYSAGRLLQVLWGVK